MSGSCLQNGEGGRPEACRPDGWFSSVKGIHRVIMVVEAEPASRHITGEAGRPGGMEAQGGRIAAGIVRIFFQNFRGGFGGMLQQEPLQFILFFLPCRICGEVVALHRV